MEPIVSVLVLLFTFYIMTEVVDKHFIKSLDNIAEWLKLPPSVAGATLLAFGTSAPEISTALIALFVTRGGEPGNPATGIGAIVGSAIFQMLVVIGFPAMIRASKLDWKPIVRDGVSYALSIVMLLFFIADGKLTLYEGIGFVVGYVVYLLVMYFWAKYSGEEMFAEEEEPEIEIESTNPVMKVINFVTFPFRWILSLIPDAQEKPQWTVPVFILSLAIIGYACYWMVIAAEALAGHYGIAPAIIALTILAGGSSVPEMISSAIVARQGRGDMAIANAVGSNIFDILMSLGFPVLLFTIMQGDIIIPAADAENINSSVTLLFASLFLVIGLMAVLKFKVGKAFGTFLMILYCGYVWAAYANQLGAINQWILGTLGLS